ncbi:MAG: hypothetical protein AAGE94_01875 [Acidobacteriota bacterium]
MSYARRLLRALDLPRGLPRLLQHDRYWRVDIVEALCDLCDDLREVGDPADEEYSAEVAYDLTFRLRDTPAALRVRVLSTLGTARRRLGHYGQAERCYRTAWALTDRGDVPLRLIGDLAERHAVLLREQGRLQSALETIRYATLIWESQGCTSAPAQVIEGVILVYLGDPRGARERFVDVLRRADPLAEERSYYAALENYAYLLGTYGSPEDLIESRRLTGEVRRAIRGIRRTPVRYRLDWIDAVLHRRLGQIDRARRDLHRARRGFVRLAMSAEVATLTIELAAVEIALDNPEAVAPLLDETLQWLQAIDLDSPMATAYFLALEHQDPETMVGELERRFAATTDPGRMAPVPLSTTGDPSD